MRRRRARTVRRFGLRRGIGRLGNVLGAGWSQLRRRPGLALRAGAALALVAALGTIAPRGIAWVVRHPYFAVEEIVMSPTRRVHPGVLLQWAGVRPGTSIWHTAPDDLAARIASHPWVQRAVVHRELPRRLTIDVAEREPLALIALERMYYVDRRGAIFAALADDEPLDLPLITGLDASGPGRRRALREALKVLHLLQARGLSFRVSEVHIEEERGVRVFPVEPVLALTFGWGGPRIKVRRLETVLASLAGRERRVREIDLTFRDEAVVRFKQT